MASINTFQSRVDDMTNVGMRSTLKRKSFSSYSTPTRSERIGRETLLLGQFEKRMKSAQWDGAPYTRPLWPSAVLPALTRYNHSYGNGVGYYFSPKTPRFLPRSVPPLAWSSRKATVTEVVSPVVSGHADRVYGDPQFVPLDSSTRSRSSLEKELADTLRSMNEYKALVDEKDRENARSKNEYKALVDKKDRENAALRRKNKALDEFSHGAMESLERDRADKLKSGLELEAFRTQVNAIRGSSSTVNEASLADDDKDEVTPYWKTLYSNVNAPSKTEKRISLDKLIASSESRLQALQLVRPKAEKKPEVDPTLVDAFTALSDEAELAVDEALGGLDRYQVLAVHDNSNIDVTRVVMQCLLPGTWLNDEVINVYMELLKERESRDPNRFLKCHFFNTFFYNKLFKDKHSYNYKAIRRWTTQKKLGYCLSDCDKVLVPIHQDIHWCLAVINIRDKKLEYLDSLKGGDRDVLDVLAMYIADEAKDKEGKVLDTATWEQEFTKEIPEQLNGCDCGMFMVKYADFHSRDAPLHFTQEHMEYFRRKMVWEILELKAT